MVERRAWNDRVLFNHFIIWFIRRTKRSLN